MLFLAHKLSELSEELKGRRIVLAVGAFDLFHAGHMDYLRWADELAGVKGVVVVMVRTDERVALQKGYTRPIIEEDERTYIVDNTKPVDFTFLGTETKPNLKTSIYAVSKLRPSAVVIGDGWSTEEALWRRHLPEVEIAKAPFPHRQSTSRIIRRIQNL